MEIKKLNFYYGSKHVIKDLSLTFDNGKITTLLGSNGCGKSTLFKLCTKELPIRHGIIKLDDKNIDDINRKDFAKKVAIVHQQNKFVGDIDVESLVSYGRNPYLSFMEGLDEKDNYEIETAIRLCGLEDIRKKFISQLSGGQLQRVWIAMSIAQKTEILFLDEPTTYLDIKYQIEILELVKKLNKELSTTIIMVLHDINQALQYSDEVVGMYNGKVEFKGDPKVELTEESISRIYDTKLSIEKFKNRLIVLPKF
ncbi:MAG: ABC transporter ATP-binding protein [Peptoniphilus sp.]|uniref:ABC transporter ATP-binding protein n=1 Tax=Peptoniphilus sp. TaxID=1971214 RepID=UPI002A747EE6|nr:ABC transporter ATP-binding protein [Peptoniphilus sp.]MDY2986911.1 ABC transporter ATP-binding protein [Peptoniphilus sp.]